MQMSDDVEARFAAIRVSYQQGHIPCRSARFTSFCARETNQQSSKKSSVPASPAKQVQVFRESQDPCTGEQSIARDHQRVVGTFHKSLQGPPASHVSRISTRALDTGHHMSCGNFHQWLDRERPSCPETFRYVLPENKRLSCVVRASLCMALCHALLFACTPFSARHAFTLIFTSSEDPPERSVALVPWLWAETVRTCALPRFDRVLRERGAVSP